MTNLKPDLFYKTKEPLAKSVLFDKLCSRLQMNGLITSINDVNTSLMKREQASDTRISYDCAMPHCQSSAIISTRIVLVDCAKFPITWYDNEHVSKVIFLLIGTNDLSDNFERVRDFVRSLATDSYTDYDESLFETI